MMDPYIMCSRQEFLFRQKSGEISTFEATNETALLPPSKRYLDPAKAVKKYRRSAAGTSKEQQYPPRNLESLFITVDYLAGLLVGWQSTFESIEIVSVSLLDLVNFVEDRMRAVQVDLVVTQIASKQLQYKIAKLHVLIIYLLSDSPKYEHKHGKQALQTALSSYWNDDGSDAHNHKHSHTRLVEMDDEMLAFTAVLQLRDDLTRCLDRQLEGVTFGSGILPFYRKHVPLGKDIGFLPLFQWTLRVIVACNLGEWGRVLRLLTEPEGTFGVLARCCIASTVMRIRTQALQFYNVSFMKEERIAVEEVARLLSMTDCLADVADTCLNLDLPVDTNSVIFKKNAIDMSWKGKHRNDAFVFGSEVEFTTDREGILIPSKATLSELLS